MDRNHQSTAPTPSPPTHGWFIELRGEINLASITDWFYMTHHFRHGILHTSEETWLVDYPDKQRCEQAMEYAKSCSCYGSWLRPNPRTGVPRITFQILHLELAAIVTIPEPPEPSRQPQPAPTPVPAPAPAPAPAPVQAPTPAPARAPASRITPPRAPRRLSRHLEIPYRRGIPLMGMGLEWFVQEIMVTVDSVRRDIDRRSRGRYRLHVAASAA
ncbi:hypothetical protein BZA77DRAFT_360456 [Pyronema omphalodes]|nr:hypothetical protein BZA77DRAFT_360456 [Pyronema omphalodes]